MPCGFIVAAMDGLIAGLASGAAFTVLATARAFSQAIRRPAPDCPGRPMARAIALVIGLAVGLLLGVAFGAVLGGTLGVLNGLATGLAFGLLSLMMGLPFGVEDGLQIWLDAPTDLLQSASSCWGGFTLVRAWLAVRGDLPWRLIAFLDDAYNVGVLRRSGTVLQFRHSALRQRLAGSPTLPPSATTLLTPG